jgi:beta-glucanase (GH16 family)
LGAAVWLALAIALAGPALGRASTTTPPSAPATATTIGPATWSDEFNGDRLDDTRWSHRATGVRNDGELTPDAVSVGGGMLTITTYTEAGKHYSGMISTAADASAGFEQAYGYFEARMKFSDAPGEWSAFWLQSPDIGSPIGDPAHAGVEMDIAEHRARCVAQPPVTTAALCAPGVDVSDRVQTGLIWDGYADRRAAIKFSDPLAGLADRGWHRFGLRWTPRDLTFYYDDAAIWTQPGPISQHSQYIVLSSEVGQFFAGTIPAAGYGTRDTTQTRLQVDYVRVWDLAHTTAPATLTPPVPVAVAPSSSTAPVVSGASQVGHPLTCSDGLWTGDAPRLSYQWLVDGTPIPGVTGAAYPVPRGARGHTLACRVTASNAAGTSDAISNAVLIPSAPQRMRPTVVATISCAPPLCRAPAVRATATGTVRVPASGHARSRTYRRTATATTSAAGTTVTIKLRFARSLRVKIARALRGGRRVVARLDARVVDSAGATGTMTRRVPLKL